MHSTSLLGLLKEFRVQNRTFGFGLYFRPNFFKWELRLWPNVKNTASVILCSRNVPMKGVYYIVPLKVCLFMFSCNDTTGKFSIHKNKFFKTRSHFGCHSNLYCEFNVVCISSKSLINSVFLNLESRIFFKTSFNWEIDQ